MNKATKEKHIFDARNNLDNQSGFEFSLLDIFKDFEGNMDVRG
jgi:hypothetical protein